jgi:hypothetical protein
MGIIRQGFNLLLATVNLVLFICQLIVYLIDSTYQIIFKNVLQF